MYVISTGAQTTLADIHSLKAKASYNHGNKEDTEFQFFSNQEIFAQIVTRKALEFIQVMRTSRHEMKLKRVFRQEIDGVTSIGCPKLNVDEFAFGTADGFVKLWNIEKAQSTHLYNANSRRTAISYVDYSPSDSFLTFSYKSGGPYIINLKGKAKVEKIMVDGGHTARFHAVNENWLGLTRSTGGFGVYDRIKKDYLYDCPFVNGGYSKELAFSKAHPNIVVSAGHHCSIYDVRDKNSVTRISNNYPLSAVCMSDCGTYICTGNFGGELASLDRRNSKKWLAISLVDTWDIHRIAFTAAFK